MRAREFIIEKWHVPPLTPRQIETLGIMALADYEDGAAAYMRGEYKTALIKLKPIAEQGDADAQLWMGVMYKDGRGVLQNYEIALSWLALAAEQEDAYAQYNLGEMHAKGLGVPPDNEMAVHWFSLAAEQGMARAQFHLELFHAYGQGVPRDTRLPLSGAVREDKQNGGTWAWPTKEVIAAHNFKPKADYPSLSMSALPSKVDIPTV